MSKIEQLVDIISAKNNLQRKYLLNWRENIRGLEIGFDNTIGFFKSRGYSIEEMAEAYLFMCDLFLIDNKYFVENGKYRYSTLAEAVKYVYNDVDVMEKYMLGLSISTYLWHQHREIMRFFIKQTKFISTKKGKYLEIGPGHGEYFVTAMENTNYDSYCAIDISATSVDITQEFCKYSLRGQAKKKYEVLKIDFFDFTFEDKFDAIIMGEVLEHVETPMTFLKKIYDVAKDDAFIYITTAINAPQPDHIYHFTTIAEVLQLFTDSNLDVVNQIALTANNVSIEKALKKKYAIVVGFVLRKM